MQGLKLNITEQLCLLFIGIGFSWVSDRGLANVTQTQITNYAQETHDMAREALELRKLQAEQYNDNLAYFNSRADSAKPSKAKTTKSKSKRKKAASKKTKTEKTPATTKRVKLAAATIATGWSYSLQFKILGPLPLNSHVINTENYAEEIDEVSVALQLESPYHQKWGGLKLRGQTPLQRLWQKNAYSDAYAASETLQLYQDIPPLRAAHHSNIYLRWAIPTAPIASRKNGRQSTNQHRGIYLQVGGIRPRSDSHWHTLRSTQAFPSGKYSLTDLPVKLPLPGMGSTSMEYNDTNGLGQNIGISWDSRFLQALLLHQRSSREEHLSTGLALRFEQLPPKNKTKVENTYRLRAAALLSQNLSQVDSSSDWYLSHTQQRQNTELYRASSDRRWPALLRYDRAVKQFYLQAGWKHKVQSRQSTAENIWSGTKKNSHVHLGAELGASVSPLDYWGLLQKYYVGLKFPIFDSANKRVLLENASYASYSDSNWIDARRRLASSTVHQWYGRRLHLQNQLNLHFQQRPQQPAISKEGEEKNSQNSLPKKNAPKKNFPKRQQQIMRLDSGVKTIRIFHSAQRSYWNLGINYYWLWYRGNTISNNVWRLTLGAQLQQNAPTSADIRPELSSFPAAPWQNEIINSLGWQQQPPSRKPLTKQRRIAHRFGWKISLKSQGHEQIGERAGLKLDLFFQVWQYGTRQQNITWWKLFQLQINLGLKSDFTQKGHLIFQAKLQGNLQLAKHWSVLLAVKLDDWNQALDGPARAPEALQIELRLSYKFQKTKTGEDSSTIREKKNLQDDTTPDDPLEVLNKPFEPEQ